MSHLFASGGQSIGTSASASILPMNIQSWFPLGLIGLISLQSSGLSRVFSSTIIQKCQFFGAQPSSSSSYICTWLLEKPQLWLYMDLSQQSDVSAFNMLSRLVIAFLPRSKCLLSSWLQSLSTVILDPKKIKSVTASTFSPSICHEVMGLEAMIFVFRMLSFKKLFHSPLLPSSRDSLVPFHFLLLEWYHVHIWGCWYFS